ncbi:copper resistance protein CopD [Aquitalea palustris]|uniref:Copper resistance protein CopD n=1 Tax=Aquitalea palustris TaxID=2480983 RepID=A0A454JED2_9NEIS|nr:copper homeostasis membrane protein CopD [Aquitalea palustris]RMC93233.1 copper resistance protein CopD [Aquitalea palustris]
MNSADYLLWLCRWLTDGAAMCLFGTAWFLLSLVPGGLGSRLWHAWQPRLARLRWLILLATLCALPLHNAILADSWADSWQISSLAMLAGESSIGRAWCWQLAAALLLVLSGHAGQRAGAAPVTALLATALLASLTLSGHAAMNEGWLGVVHQLNDLLHLLAAAAWLGALPLVLQLMRQTGPWRQPAMQALIRFSTAGHALVAVVILTGLGNFYLINGSLLPDGFSAYTILLGLKLLAVLGMVLLAVFNRYYLVPRMRDKRSAIPWFIRAVNMQIALCLLALALLACLGTLDPY